MPASAVARRRGTSWPVVAPAAGGATWTSADTVVAAWLLDVASGWPWHAGTSGVDSAHSGRDTRRNRRAQSPPYAFRKTR